MSTVSGEAAAVGDSDRRLRSTEMIARVVLAELEHSS